MPHASKVTGDALANMCGEASTEAWQPGTNTRIQQHPRPSRRSGLPLARCPLMATSLPPSARCLSRQQATCPWMSPKILRGTGGRTRAGSARSSGTTSSQSPSSTGGAGTYRGTVRAPPAPAPPPATVTKGGGWPGGGGSALSGGAGVPSMRAEIIASRRRVSGTPGAGVEAAAVAAGPVDKSAAGSEAEESGEGRPRGGLRWKASGKRLGEGGTFWVFSWSCRTT